MGPGARCLLRKRLSQVLTRAIHCEPIASPALTQVTEHEPNYRRNTPESSIASGGFGRLRLHAMSRLRGGLRTFGLARHPTRFPRERKPKRHCSNPVWALQGRLGKRIWLKQAVAADSNRRNVSEVSTQAYYRRDLALVHHLGYGFHAEACAPGILTLLEPVRERRGLVLELGCGSGALTRHLVAAGHRVVATDASSSMLALAREAVPGAEELRLLKLPDDPLPECDAVVSVGHVLSYLPNEASLEAALVAAAKALRPGGVFAIDLLDLHYGDDMPPGETPGRVGDDWAVVVRLSRPEERLYVREITTFVRNDDGTWRRDDERHENVLVETSRIPALLAAHGLDARVAESFAEEELPPGLVAIVGDRRR